MVTIIEKGQVLTPEKKILLIEEIRLELQQLNTLRKQAGVGASALEAVKIHSEKLQALLNTLVNKTGVVTPDETTAALDAINDSKRSRLQGSYYMGMSRTTLFFVLLAGGAVALYYYMKKRQ